MHVRISVDLESAIHLGLIVVSVGSFFRRHVLHSLFQSGILTLQQNHILWKQLGVDGVSWERIVRVRLNTLILLLKEDGLAISLSARISIKDETLIFAGSGVQLQADDLVKHLVRKANLDLRSIKFGILLLVSRLLILCNSNILQFLDFSTDFIAKSILEFHGQ